MFESLTVVSSAVASFQNAALRAPDFLWMSLLCLPVFYAAWVFAPNIRERFNINENRVVKFTLACIAVWLVARVNFGVLRGGFLIPGIIWGSALIVALSAFFKDKIRLFKKVNQKTCATIAILITTLLMASQPEFLRFGQLGMLSIFHIISLTIMAIIFGFYCASKYVRPNNWLRESWYKKLKLLGRIFAILTFVLFVVTESELMLIGLIIISLIYFWIGIRHKKMMSNYTNFLWTIMLGGFGVITNMPLLVCLAILIYKKPNVNELKTLL